MSSLGGNDIFQQNYAHFSQFFILSVISWMRCDQNGYKIAAIKTD